MALIMGDIHGNLAKARAFLAYRPKEVHVCLGDYVDSFTESSDIQLQCLHLLLKSKARLLWGNHDLHYLPNPLWRCNGFQPAMAASFRRLFVTSLATGRITAALAIDGWLCTHAGVHPQLIERQMTAAEAADYLNDAFTSQLAAGGGPVFYTAFARGGKDPFGGIFWFDPFREGVEPSSTVGKQIFGHTEQPQPQVTPLWACIDTVNAAECWVFDTDSGEAFTI